jgi:hypothetical protein
MTDTSGSKQAKPFDIRRVIGALFAFYGLLVGGAGLFDGSAARAKAAGIDINLWAGLGMLAFGIGFLVWMRLNPVQPPPAPDEPAEDERVVDLRERSDQDARSVH